MSASPPPPPRLDDIPTAAVDLRTPEVFVARYGSAMRAYVRAMLPTADAADELMQEFLLRFLERGFGRFDPARGRFRDYLKAALRNAVASHHRKGGPPSVGSVELEAVPAGEPSDAWEESWRTCLLERAWARLAEHERATPGNAYHTVLRLQADHPSESSTRLAARASESVGRTVSAAAFRQHARRARRRFAELLAAEVAMTVEPMTWERIAEELAELRLLAYVQGHLPR